MSSNDEPLPTGLAKTLRAGLDAQRRRAQAQLSLEIYRAANKRADGDDRLRPGLPVKGGRSRASENP